MALTYDEAVKNWAADHFDIPIEHITNVHFSLDVEGDRFGGCSTCGHGGPESVCEVQVLYRKPKRKTESKTERFDDFDFPKLIAALLGAPEREY